MTLFLLAFFLVYGGTHVYAFIKAKTALSFGSMTGAVLIFFMALMCFVPIIIRYSEKYGLEFAARFMSYAGYSWMGILFLFFSASLAFDIYSLLIHSAGFVFKKNLSAISPSVRLSFLISLFLAIAIGVYGFFEARNILTERVLIKTGKIPKEVGRLRIVQISDVHNGLIVREERLRRILDKVNAAAPDILVSTGDLVDGQINNNKKSIGLFKEIRPRYGKFAVTGNHEFYAGLEQALDFTKEAGFVILRGDGLTVEGLINIAGVDDPQGEAYGLYKGVSEKELLSGLRGDRFTLMLKHRPVIDKASIGLFDLQLSGHLHKGQIFPFSIVTWLCFPAHAGLLNLQDNSKMYVSRGSGTWGPPIRFMSRPEVTVIELIYESQ